MKLLSHKFKRLMDLTHFNKADQKRILRLALFYLLGLQPYTKVYNKLKEYGCHGDFSRFLRSLTDKECDYIISKMRPFAQALSRGVKIKSGLTKTDRMIVTSFQSDLPYKNIPVVSKYPTLEVVCHEMRGSIINRAKVFFRSFNDPGQDLYDIVGDLNLKLIEAYRLYILRFGVKGFNEKMLYRCMHNSLNTKVVDLHRSVSSIKRSGHLNSVSYNEEFIGEHSSSEGSNCEC